MSQDEIFVLDISGYIREGLKSPQIQILAPSFFNTRTIYRWGLWSAICEKFFWFI